jgi:hypothetical protein
LPAKTTRLKLTIQTLLLPSSLRQADLQFLPDLARSQANYPAKSRNPTYKLPADW